MKLSNAEINEIRQCYNVPPTASHHYFTATSVAGRPTSGYGNIIEIENGIIDVVINDFNGNEDDGDEDVYYEEYICFRF